MNDDALIFYWLRLFYRYYNVQNNTDGSWGGEKGVVKMGLINRKTKAGKHLAGALLLLMAISSPGLMALLPSRSDAHIDLPFLNTSQQSTVLAFAGFPGCDTICPVSLSILSDVYRNLNSEYNSMEVELMFINIQLDTPDEITDAYAKSYHPNFSSYSVKSKEAYDIYKALSLRTFENMQDSYPHTGYIYVFVRTLDKWNIEHVYQQTPSSRKIISDLKQLKQIA